MTKEQSIFPLLNDLVRDNPSYKFPIESITKELTQMFLLQDEFEYFSIQTFRKLKRDYGNTIAHIFLTVMDMKLNLNKRDIHTIPTEQYQNEIENFITSLENLLITRIEKDSSDGELISAMI